MRISNQKKEKIYEQILAVLYSNSPNALFTINIAQELARDEEFIKSLLIDLRKKGVVLEVKKSPEGLPYLKRSRWALTDVAYQAYKKHQQNPIPSSQNNKTSLPSSTPSNLSTSSNFSNLSNQSNYSNQSKLE